MGFLCILMFSFGILYIAGSYSSSVNKQATVIDK
jgi:hypothetical protein